MEKATSRWLVWLLAVFGSFTLDPSKGLLSTFDCVLPTSRSYGTRGVLLNSGRVRGLLAYLPLLTDCSGTVDVVGAYNPI
jgi:hypothetical protein